MPLSVEERDRIKYHLGFLAVSPAASIQLGIARPVQTLFLIEDAMDNLLEVAVPRVLQQLVILDNIESEAKKRSEWDARD